MTVPEYSNPPIPFDVVAVILKFALATPTPAPPNAVDRQLRMATLTLNHEIRNAFITDIYSTMVFWSMSSIRKFADTLDTSPYLGSLVINLWAGNNEIKLLQPGNQNEAVKNGCEDVVHCLRRLLATMPNLRRLYVAVNVEEYWHTIECPIPESTRHLVLPSNWLDRTPSKVAGIFEVPPDLGSVRIRGRPQSSDAVVLANASSRPLRITVEMYDDEDDFPEISAVLMAMLNSMGRPPWKCLIEVASSPALFEHLRAAMARLGRKLGSFLEMERASIVSQLMDDVGQLELWLSEGEPSLFGPF
ncbi:hypothetical protein FRC10_001626 [Ceratobasidium sp. 414]|nr:hypothetical protein FRC10_001626 [Ceratobasidium sp. 414]